MKPHFRWQVHFHSRKTHGTPVIAAFDNPLTEAEGELRAKIATRIGAEGKDIIFLLSILSRDCVDALQFLPMDEDIEYREISEEETVADLKTLPRPNWRKVRMMISGYPSPALRKKPPIFM